MQIYLVLDISNRKNSGAIIYVFPIAVAVTSATPVIDVSAAAAVEAVAVGVLLLVVLPSRCLNALAASILSAWPFVNKSRHES